MPDDRWCLSCPSDGSTLWLLTERQKLMVFDSREDADSWLVAQCVTSDITAFAYARYRPSKVVDMPWQLRRYLPVLRA